MKTAADVAGLAGCSASWVSRCLHENRPLKGVDLQKYAVMEGERAVGYADSIMEALRVESDQVNQVASDQVNEVNQVERENPMSLPPPMGQCLPDTPVVNTFGLDIERLRMEHDREMKRLERSDRWIEQGLTLGATIIGQGGMQPEWLQRLLVASAAAAAGYMVYQSRGSVAGSVGASVGIGLLLDALLFRERSLLAAASRGFSPATSSTPAQLEAGLPPMPPNVMPLMPPPIFQSVKAM